MSTAESMTGESKLNFLLSPVVYVIYFCIFAINREDAGTC